MKRDNIFSIAVMGCGLLLILSVFLPYVSYFSTSLSLWKMEDPSRIIYVLLGLFIITLYLINRKTEMAYIAAGYGTLSCISQAISIAGLNGLSIGFYLILISSIAIGVLTFLYDESKADALVNLSVSVNKPVMGNQATVNVNSINNNGMDRVNVSPISQHTNNSFFDQQSTESKPPMKFDPITGKPIYFNKENDTKSNN